MDSHEAGKCLRQPIHRQWYLSLGLALMVFPYLMLSENGLAQSPGKNSAPTRVAKGEPEQAFSSKPAAISAEEGLAAAPSGAYSLKLLFADSSGKQLSGVRVVMHNEAGEKTSDLRTRGPWFYRRVVPGKYSVVITYQDKTAQLEEVSLNEGDHLTRTIYWDLKQNQVNEMAKLDPPLQSDAEGDTKKSRFRRALKSLFGFILLEGARGGHRSP